MAQAIKSVKVTPADELRELLASSERRVANLRGSGLGALDLLLNLDRISELWPELEAQGVDLRPELGRWEGLLASLRRRAPILVREMRMAGGLPAARATHHPGDQAGWWWFLAEEVQKQRSRRLVRGAVILGGVAAAAVLLYYLVFHVLFPVDPKIAAALHAQSAGEQKISAQGDYAAALIDFHRAAELRPDDPAAWLWAGCTSLKLGETAAAEEDFERARLLLADDKLFWLARAPICTALGLLDRAEADLQAVIAADPEDAEAHYHLATVLEARGALGQAIAALERASTLAEAKAQHQLVAMARFRMAMLMQQLAGQPLPAPTPTP